MVVLNRTAFLISLVSIALFMDSLAYGLIVPIVPSYAQGLGASDLEIGIIFTAYPVVQLLTMIPIGILSDKYGRRPFIVLGLVALAVSTLAFAASTDAFQLILTRGLQGFAAACTVTAGLALVSERASSGTMGGSLGIATAAQGAGFVAGPVVGGYLLEAGGYAFPFLVAAALTLIISALTILALRGVKERREEKISLDRLAWTDVLKNRTLLAVILIVTAWSVGFGFLEPAYPTYLSQRFGATAAMVGAFFTALSFPYMLSQPFFGKLSDRIGRKLMVVAATLMFAALFPLLALADSFTSAVVVAALLGLASGVLFAPSLPLMIDTLASRLGGGSEGVATGLYNTAFALGLSGGPMIFGLLLGAVGLEAISLAYSALVIVTACLAFVMIKEPRRSS